jgi:hypothetical protein
MKKKKNRENNENGTCTSTPNGPQNPMVWMLEATWVWISGLDDDLNPLFRCNHRLTEQIGLMSLRRRGLRQGSCEVGP